MQSILAVVPAEPIPAMFWLVEGQCIELQLELTDSAHTSVGNRAHHWTTVGTDDIVNRRTAKMMRCTRQAEVRVFAIGGRWRVEASDRGQGW